MIKSIFSKIAEDKKEQNKKITKRAESKKITFTKKIVICILVLAELEIVASYVLAFLGKSDIAESLSSQIVVTVIGTIIGYFAKSLVENIFKNNKIFKNDTQYAPSDELIEVVKVEKSQCKNDESIDSDTSQDPDENGNYG